MKIFTTTSPALKTNICLALSLLLGGVALLQVVVPARWAFRCQLHSWTGLPCPSCGTTRCLQLALRGDITGAWEMQPLAFCLASILGIWVVYSILATLFKWPVLYIHFEHRSEWYLAFACATALFAANWAYLIFNG